MQTLIQGLQTLLQTVRAAKQFLQPRAHITLHLIIHWGTYPQTWHLTAMWHLTMSFKNAGRIRNWLSDSAGAKESSGGQAGISEVVSGRESADGRMPITDCRGNRCVLGETWGLLGMDVVLKRDGRIESVVSLTGPCSAEAWARSFPAFIGVDRTCCTLMGELLVRGCCDCSSPILGVAG